MNATSVFLHICCGPCSLMPVVHLRNEGFDVTAFFFNPNIHPEEEYDLRRASAQLAADKLGYPIVFAGEAQKPAGGSGSWMESLWKENAVRSVIGNACCRRLRKRGNGVSGFLRPVCCIRDTSIMRRFVWRQNKLHGKPGYHFCTGISGHTGMTGSIFQKNWGCIVRNGAVVF